MWNKLHKKYRYSLILLRELVRTDFKIKYQDSSLGYLWTILKPLFLFGILYLVFAIGLKVGKDIEHWPVALLAGVVLWQFFTDVTSSGLKAIVNRGSLLRKIKFPRYIVIISGTLSSFLTLLINSVVVLVFAIANGVPLSPQLPLVIPIIIEVFIFSLGLAFLLGTIYVKFRDIQHIWDVITRGLFYASAIIFPMSLIAEHGENGVLAAKILLLNPIAQAIQDVRNVAINPEITSLWTLTNDGVLYLVPLAITALSFVAGAWYFKRRSAYFAEDA